MNNDNKTRIVDLEKLKQFKSEKKSKDIDVTEIVLLSGYAGLVVLWVVACCA